ncbi:MAG: anaerobic ribonucleoside-triphosphate reductase activating protein [Methanoregula sp.]
MIPNGDGIRVNFGGFIPLSTVDWRGRSVCTVFFRGCPLRCSYCQNSSIFDGEDYRRIEEIISLIKSSKLAVSGVIFSGGEPTMQKDPLLALARAAKSLGLATGIQTNGIFPDTIETLVNERVIDKIAIDYKTQWEGYSCVGNGSEPSLSNYRMNVLRSIEIAGKAYREKILPELEVVVTVFYENVKYLQEISKTIGDIPLVLQQGEHKMPMLKGGVTNTSSYITQTQKWNTIKQYTPMTLAEIQKIADGLKRDVRIRTRDIGEMTYTRKYLL